jgi:hypothetical protein
LRAIIAVSELAKYAEARVSIRMDVSRRVAGVSDSIKLRSE